MWSSTQAGAPVMPYSQGLPGFFNNHIVPHFDKYDEKYMCCCSRIHVRVGAIWIILSIALTFAYSLFEIKIGKENSSFVVNILVSVGLSISFLFLLMVVITESSILAQIFLFIYIPANLLYAYTYAVEGAARLPVGTETGDTTIALVFIFRAVELFLRTMWFSLVIDKLAHYYDDKSKA